MPPELPCYGRSTLRATTGMYHVVVVLGRYDANGRLRAGGGICGCAVDELVESANEGPLCGRCRRLMDTLGPEGIAAAVARHRA